MAVVVLGRPGVRVGFGVSHPARRMAGVLLGLLAIRANRTLSVECIIDALWPGKPPASAAANVRSHLAELRRLLPATDPVIVTSRDGYALVARPDGVDVTHFRLLVAEGRRSRGRSDVEAERSLARAVALWRGPVLAGVPVPDVLRPDVAVLEEQRLDAVEDLLEVRLALGGHQELVPVLAGLVVEHPLRERLWRLLVGALDAAGRRTEALVVYRRLTRVLAAELGVTPCAATNELYEVVKRRT
ncbi:AfsR/SARP family transcriptional regulator [Actinosynnema sp. NPDC020468]|uniref:AfsR/SARP family transcriptional regulator n=1 Tax=Actinosynnema sp. NPDC020468 TaxID=3154488 RepID=UPI0033F97D4A